MPNIAQDEGKIENCRHALSAINTKIIMWLSPFTQLFRVYHRNFEQMQSFVNTRRLCRASNFSTCGGGKFICMFNHLENNKNVKMY